MLTPDQITPGATLKITFASFGYTRTETVTVGTGPQVLWGPSHDRAAEICVPLTRHCLIWRRDDRAWSHESAFRMRLDSVEAM